MFRIFKLKKAAMFGIDARVTFAVTAIAAFIVGVNQFTDIERDNKASATLDLRQIKNSTLQYYEDNYSVPASVNSLMTDGYLLLNQEDNIDPWGGSYELHSVTQNKTIGKANMVVKYFVVMSLGKNGIRNTSVPADYNQWLTLEASDDDIIEKFSSIEIEEKIAEVETNQLKIVQSLINNYIEQRKSALASYCDNSINQRDFRCDVNEDALYDDNEELTINFMLKDIDDNKGKYYIVQHISHSTDAEFKSGYIKDDSHRNYNMYSFIEQIGGSSVLVKSPRGLVLHFSSNKYGNTQYPYYAEVWYDNEVTVF